MMSELILAWRSWRRRNAAVSFLRALQAFDDDPILMCGCPAGMPCGDLTDDVAA